MSTEPETSTPAPRFVDTKTRSETVTLDWPLEYDGKTYETITISRMSAAQVAAFVKSIESMSPEEREGALFPVYDVPNAVIHALDQDDADKVNEVVTRFLPRLFRADGTGK